MYKILVALLISCVSVNVFAACPAKLIGKYSGHITYTQIGSSSSVDEVAEKLLVISFDGKGTATGSRYVEVNTSSSGVEIVTTQTTLSYSFDKNSCSVQIIDSDHGDINAVVANSGNTLYGVKRDSTYNGVQRFEFTKQ